MKPATTIAALVCAFAALATSADWRKEGAAEEQLSNLVTLVPGTAHWMSEMGERYKNLYWAAKQHRWEFAQYQVEEIEKLVTVVQLARPKRAKTAQEFLDTGIPAVSKGVKARNWDTFKSGFARLQKACMECHVKNDHAFIAIPHNPATASSPVLNLSDDD